MKHKSKAVTNLESEEFSRFNPLAVQGLLLRPDSQKRLSQIQRNLIDIYFRLSRGALESVLYLTQLVKDESATVGERMEASQILMQYLVSKPPAQIEAKTETVDHSFTFSATLGSGYKETAVIDADETDD